MGSRDPNVLLVVLDSVRARNCGLYGHDNETTPHLTELANRATRFDQCRAPSIHSVSSHASIFSGHHVPEHGVTEHESYLDPAATIWHDLRTEHGYETGLFTPNAVVGEASNLAEPFGAYVGPRRETSSRLFDDGIYPPDVDGGAVPFLRASLRDDAPLRSLANGLHFRFRSSKRSHDPERERAGVYVDELLSWVGERDGPWAACLNLMDAHYPYVPAEEHDRWAGDAVADVREAIPDGPLSRTFLSGRPWGQLAALEPLYDGCIRQADAAVGRLVESLKAAGELENTLLVVTSDHGEGFGERSALTPAVRLVDHSWGIAEALTHVPLVVKAPGQVAEKRVTAPATLTRFPAAVQAALAGDDVDAAFVPEEAPVRCSTVRIEAPGDELPIPAPDREPYFGPWRAVYHERDGTVYKYATRQDDEVALAVHDAQTATPVDADAAAPVERAFDDLSAADVRIGDAEDRQVEDDVEDRLADLGYLR